MSVQRDWLWIAPPKKMIDEIIERVADEHGLTVADLRFGSSKRHIAWARHQVMWEAYQTGKYSTNRIGEKLGGLDHTTVLYGIKRHSERMCGEAVD